MLQNSDAVAAVSRITPQWIAGFFDGEGTICAYFSKNQTHIHVSFTQKDPKILALISLKYGGGTLSSKKGSSKATCWSLNFGGTSCLPVLYDIKDHAVVKRRQVELGIEFCRLIGPGGKEIKPGVSSRRLEICKEVSALNHGAELYQKEVLPCQTSPTVV